MNLSAKIGGFTLSVAKAATHVGGQYDPDRTFKTMVLVMVILAGTAMTAIFLYHGVADPNRAAEYLPFGSGLGTLGLAGGGGAWLHSKAKEATQ